MKTTSVITNFLYQVCYQILILAFPLITSPYISRILGAEGLGTYSYSYAIAYYFVLISMLGILNYGNRSIARCRDNQDNLNKEFSGIVTLHIILSMGCVMFYILYMLYAANEKLYAFMQLPYVISGLFDITWFYHGIEKFKLTVTRKIFIKIATVILIFVFVKTVDDVWIYCLIMSGSMLLDQIILWAPLKKYVSYTFPSKKEIIKHIKPMLILFIPTIAISLYYYMDRIMIVLLGDKKQLGYYENAENMIKVIRSVIGSLGTVMLPQMSNLTANRNMEQFYKFIKASMRYVMMMALAMSFGLAAVAKVFAPFFWGMEFQISGKLIQILVISVPFSAFANVIRTQYLLPQEKDLEYMLSVLAGAGINLTVNAVLIPKYGASGAAVATALTEVMVCTVQVVAAKKKLPICAYLKDAIPFGILGIGMFMIVYAIGNLVSKPISCLVIQVLVGGVIYGCFAVGILYIKGDALVTVFWHKRIMKGKNINEDDKEYKKRR